MTHGCSEHKGNPLHTCQGCRDAWNTAMTKPTAAPKPMTADDRCPKCKSTDVCYHGDTEKDYVECDSCGHTGEESDFWPTREELGLPADTCAACNRRRSWGCGHTYQDELDMLAHQDTTDHLLGDCECFVRRPGYMPFHTREEWRERVASVVRRLRDTPGNDEDLVALLYRR